MIYKINQFKTLDSTNEFLKELAKNNDLEEGQVISADYQTRGKGQGKNSWESDYGGLYFSILFKPNHLDPIFTLMLGISFAEKIQDLFQIPIKLKWPNDLILKGKKLGGILVETIVSGGEYQMISGCGINLNQKNLPIINNYEAISLSQYLGFYVNKDQLLNSLLESINRNYKYYSNLNNKKIISKFSDFDFLKEKKILIEKASGELVTGIGKGLNEKGELLLSQDNNDLISISSGRVIDW